MAFNSNVFVTFIHTIYPTSFNYGILLDVNEQMFHRLYRTLALTMIDIMVSLINTVIKYIFKPGASQPQAGACLVS